MKKLLYQFDTDPLPAVFDNVVAYDGGADHVIPYGGVTPKNVGALVDGAIFTRAPKDKKLTAIFVGGANMAEDVTYSGTIAGASSTLSPRWRASARARRPSLAHLASNEAELER